jgi:hypothetical protein
MDNEFVVKLISPSFWEDLVSLEPVAHSVLTTLHNRHIGITPKLAAELAKRITAPQGYKQGSDCWDKVLKRLLEESSEGIATVGVLLNAIPLYSVIRLAGPIVEEACNRIGKCFLFCQEEVSSDVSEDDYIQYDFLLEREIRRMAINKDDYFKTFWKDRALTLATYSRRAPSFSRTEARLADIDPSALAMLLHLNPKLVPSKALSIHPKTIVNPMKHREIRRMREGGFSGIHVTRRIEDMGDILLSEFLNPKAVLADRLINNGYLALRRQTKREQLRDILVVGMMPESMGPQPSKDFIKACWFDFISRFGFMLYRSRLKRSEFRWLQGDDFGRVRCCNFLLKELQDLDIPVEGDLTPDFRRDFLMALGWLPRYLDNHGFVEKVPQYKASPQQLKVSGELGTEVERQWAYSAWRSQKENLKWALHESDHSPLLPGMNDGGEKGLDIGGYAFVHIMLFMPASKRQTSAKSAAARLGPLYSGLGLGSDNGNNNGHQYGASITWVPENISDIDAWAFDARSNRSTPLFPPQKDEWSTHTIAGRLEETWRHLILKELQDG